MYRFASALVAAGLVAASPAPAGADEVTDTLEGALAAYRDGDVTGAQQDVEYATKLLVAMRGEALAKFLPAALPGWTRSDEDGDATGGMAAMFGGGTAATATYTKDDGTELVLSLVANSPVVSGIASMVSGIASMGTGGKPMRIGRTEFADSDGDLQGVVGGKVLVSASGDATVEDKKAYLEALDFTALAAF